MIKQKMNFNRRLATQNPWICPNGRYNSSITQAPSVNHDVHKHLYLPNKNFSLTRKTIQKNESSGNCCFMAMKNSFNYLDSSFSCIQNFYFDWLAFFIVMRNYIFLLLAKIGLFFA